MPRNHRNRSWRSQWKVSESGESALHKSGIIAVLDSELNTVCLINAEQSPYKYMAILHAQAFKLLVKDFK